MITNERQIISNYDDTNNHNKYRLCILSSFIRTCFSDDDAIPTIFKFRKSTPYPKSYLKQKTTSVTHFNIFEDRYVSSTWRIHENVLINKKNICRNKNVVPIFTIECFAPYKSRRTVGTQIFGNENQIPFVKINNEHLRHNSRDCLRFISNQQVVVFLIMLRCLSHPFAFTRTRATPLLVGVFCAKREQNEPKQIVVRQLFWVNDVKRER